MSATDLILAEQKFNVATRIVGNFFEQFDVVLTPTLGSPPPKLGFFNTSRVAIAELLKRHSQFFQFTWIHNVTGCPAMSVPLCWKEGLPVGVQFASRYANEATLFQLARQLEEARPWKRRRPTL